MSEPLEEELRRQTFIRVMRLVSAGIGRCAGCQQQAEIFSKRRTTPTPGKERCLDCWRAER
jgi:hypothetical protein